MARIIRTITHRPRPRARLRVQLRTYESVSEDSGVLLRDVRFSRRYDIELWANRRYFADPDSTGSRRGCAESSADASASRNGEKGLRSCSALVSRISRQKTGRRDGALQSGLHVHRDAEIRGSESGITKRNRARSQYCGGGVARGGA